jgi:hypothetical protein
MKPGFSSRPIGASAGLANPAYPAGIKTDAG